MKSLGWSAILSFALRTACSPMAAPEMTVNGRASISEDLLATLVLYSQYAGASYCNSESAVGSTVTCSGNACPNVTAAGATITATYSGDKTDIEGFVSTDATNKVIVVSIRGSHSIRNWIADFEFLQQDCSFASGCKVHDGFATAWDEISSAVLAAVKDAKSANPDYKIVFTGHSLGAAVSSLGGAYARQAGFEVDIINYGSPRVGNVAFATFLSNSPGAEYRVTHLDDPVPRLPPILFSYAHTTPELWLSDGKDYTDDYGVKDIKECDGVQSVDCNASTLGLDIISHLHYLGPIAGCSPIEIAFRKRDAEDYLWWEATSPAKNINDTALEAQLNDWAQKDLAAMSG
ncbi:extracellular lipase [Xylaria intraflava]|nr:extracellular lipase [Xylaria intraflava]